MGPLWLSDKLTENTDSANFCLAETKKKSGLDGTVFHPESLPMTAPLSTVPPALSPHLVRRFGRLVVCVAGVMAAIARAAAPAEAPSEARFLSHPRQLTFEGRRSGEGYFSPDGAKLIFQSESETNNPFYQIYILDLDTGDRHRVSPGLGKTTCGFFRPGTDEVLFASSHGDSEAQAKQDAELAFRAAGKTRRYAWDYDETMEIFSARRDGSHLRRLTKSAGYDAEASYSPDGKKIVFTSLRSAYPAKKLSPEDRKQLESDPAYFGEIYVMDADGSHVRRLTDTPGYDGGPFFSPDGQRIVWRRFEPNGVAADLFTMDRNGGDVRRLTNFGCMSWAPYYHPSGRYLIFTANKLGFSNFELFLVDSDGQHEPVRVTFSEGFDGLPSFSPDGCRLCWTSNRGSSGASQIFLADWNHDAALAALQEAPSSISTNSTTPGPSAAAAATAELHPAIRQDDMEAEVGYLASDALEGRETGSRGAALASAYLTEHLQAAGLKPLNHQTNLFDPFEFNAGVRILTNQNHFIIRSGPDGLTTNRLSVDQDFRPLSFSSNGRVEGGVVFAGYGLSVPGKGETGYDSYAGLDVSNKLVLVLRYVPEGVDAKRRAELNLYAGLRYKAMIARERGARALLVVTGPNSPHPGKLASLSFDSSLSGSGIIAASISGDAAGALLAGAGKTLGDLQSALDTENPHAQGRFTISNLAVQLEIALAHIEKTGRNVLAWLPPDTNSTNRGVILVGAHYDHLGYGGAGSLERKGEEGEIHNGADDNASGVATVLELAAAFAAKHQKNPALFQRGMLFAFWSGEEIGLIGSSAFAQHHADVLSNTVAYLNFDMVGRLRDNKLVLQGIGSSPVWPRLIEKRNVPAGFDLSLQDDPYLPTDVTAIYPKGVPVLNFFTGSHENYHRPTDDPDTLNYEGMVRIARFAKGILTDLLEAAANPAYTKVQQHHEGGGRDQLRVYLGTIPDYTVEVEGVKLSGVRGGGPADKAGLRGGDIIVGFGGRKITNIYDYTYALDAAKIGEPLNVVVLRDGKRLSLTVIPEARN